MKLIKEINNKVLQKKVYEADGYEISFSSIDGITSIDFKPLDIYYPQIVFNKNSFLLNVNAQILPDEVDLYIDGIKKGKRICEYIKSNSENFT